MVQYSKHLFATAVRDGTRDHRGRNRQGELRNSRKFKVGGRGVKGRPLVPVCLCLHVPK